MIVPRNIEKPPLGNIPNSLLPIVDLEAEATTMRNAVVLANRAADALRDYNKAQQAANGIPPEKRVILQKGADHVVPLDANDEAKLHDGMDWLLSHPRG